MTEKQRNRETEKQRNRETEKQENRETERDRERKREKHYTWRLIAAAKNPSCRASNRLWSRERELREPRVASSWPGRDANWFSDSIRMCRFLNYKRNNNYCISN